MSASPALGQDVVIKREDVESSRALGSGSEEPVAESPRRSSRVQKSVHTERAVSARSINKEEEREEKIRIKREDTIFALSDNSIALRLAPIEEEMNTKFGADRKAPTDDMQLTPVSRLFISWFQGGSTQMTVTPPSKRLELLDGVELFAYPMPSWNPLAPKAPTAAGLAFIETDYTDTVRVFIKKNEGWLYCGDYIFQMTSCLTVDEWNSQSKLVRDTWVSERFGKDWHSERHKPSMQKKLAYYLVQRKQPFPWKPYTPTEEEMDECIGAGEIDKVTPDKVRDDLDNGRMFVPVRGLCLHSYDPDYQKKLVEGSRSRAWAAEQEKRATRNAAKKARQALGLPLGTAKQNKKTQQALGKKSTRRKSSVLRKAVKLTNAATLARLRVQATWDIDSDEESDEDDEDEAPPTGTGRVKRTRDSMQSDTVSESALEKPASKRMRKDSRANEARGTRMAYIKVPIRKSRTRVPSPIL